MISDCSADVFFARSPLFQPIPHPARIEEHAKLAMALPARYAERARNEVTQLHGSPIERRPVVWRKRPDLIPGDAEWRWERLRRRAAIQDVGRPLHYGDPNDPNHPEYFTNLMDTQYN